MLQVYCIPLYIHVIFSPNKNTHGRLPSLKQHISKFGTYIISFGNISSTYLPLEKSLGLRSVVWVTY